MRAHWLQHAQHEGLGCIGPWLKSKQYSVTHSRLYAGEPLPGVQDFDWLIVMGGPMNIYEHGLYPWLESEKNLIYDACVTNKHVIGICLGAQLLSDALGGKVTKNKYEEIGWFNVSLTEVGSKSNIVSCLPKKFAAFHWHEDTFSIPDGAANLIKSDACVNQCFVWGRHVLGVQFHLEVTEADARAWLRQGEPVPRRYVQSGTEILRDPSRFAACNDLMVKLLERMGTV